MTLSSSRASSEPQALDWTVLGKDRLSLFQMRSEALLCLGPREPEHLERCGGVEDRAVHAKPVVKRVLGPADSALRAIGQAFGCLKRGLMQIHIVNTKRDKPNPLRLFARQRLTRQQVILCLGQTA